MPELETQTIGISSAQLGFLRYSDVAGVLPITGFVQNPELPVKRLVARSVLPAIQLGGIPGSPNRVPLDELQKYIRAGAPDLQPPPLSHDWPSFPDLSGLEWMIGGFVNDVTELMGAQVPADASQFDFTTGQTPSMELKITSDIMALIKAPAAKPTIPSDGAAPIPTPSPFTCMGQAYLVSRLRTFARWEASMADESHMGGSQKLYESPTMYTAIVTAAAAKMQQGKIVFSRQFKVVLPDRSGRKVNSLETVQFFISDKAVMAAAMTTIEDLARLAF